MEKDRQSLNLWIPAVAMIILFFVNNWAIPLWNADEAAYAGISHRMTVSGDWMEQGFYYSDIHRKPPLHFWLTAISMEVFGSNEWAVRFFSSIFSLLSIFLVYKFAGRYYGQRAGLLAALIFGTNLMIMALGKIAFTDATLLVAQILCGFSLFQLSDKGHDRRALWIFWAAMALGLMVKGPQIIIPMACLTLAMTISGMDRQILFKLKPWLYIPLSLIPLFLWGYFSWQQDDGAFIRWLLDWYVFRRVGGSVLGQTGPPGYYLIVLSVVFMIYFAGFFGVLRKIVLRTFKKRSLEGFLIFWALCAWLPFEILPSKLPHYVAGAIPPLSILTALSLYTITGEIWKKTWLRLAVFIQLALTALLASALVYLIQEQFGFRGLLISILTGLVPIISTVLFVIKLDTGKFRSAGYWLAGGAILFGIMVFLPLMNMLRPVLSGPVEIGQKIGFETQSQDTVLLARHEKHLISVPFYIEREANIKEAWQLEGALNQVEKYKFKAIVGDSLLARSLEESYRSEKIKCFDINDQSYKDYYVIIRK